MADSVESRDNVETLEEAIEQSELHPKVRQLLGSAHSSLDSACRSWANNPAIDFDSRFTTARDNIEQVISAVDQEVENDE